MIIPSLFPLIPPDTILTLVIVIKIIGRDKTFMGAINGNDIYVYIYIYIYR